MNSIFIMFLDLSQNFATCIAIIVYALGLMEFLKPFTDNKIAKWLSCAAYAVVMAVLFFFPDEFDNLTTYGTGIIVSFVVLIIIDHKNYIQKFFLAFSFFSVRWFTAAISMAIWVNIYTVINDRIIGLFSFNEAELISFYSLLNTIRDCFIAAVMHFMIKIFHKVYVIKNETMNLKEALLLVLPSVLGVFNYRTMLYFNSIDTREINIKPYDLISFIYYIVSYAVLIVVIYFYEQIKAAQRKEKELAMLSVQTDNIREYISGAESLYHDISAIRHDMKNHLAVLERLNERGEKEAFNSYLSEAREKIGIDINIASGNPVTDVILTEKRSEAVKRGIAFECDFHYPADFSGGALDMSIILNNALNNAIEAAEKCPENKRRICISSFKSNNAFSISVVNAYADEIVLNNSSLPHTTKKDSHNHGFGLVNIRNAAEKYSGGIDIECKDGEFTLTVMLMIK